MSNLSFIGRLCILDTNTTCQLHGPKLSLSGLTDSQPHTVIFLTTVFSFMVSGQHGSYYNAVIVSWVKGSGQQQEMSTIKCLDVTQK